MTNLKWWQKAVFYQIYPRSFADGNGDGIGDFPGIIDKLLYLKELGIDALWLSPHFPSPQADCGYDVSDYTDVAPEYGTLDEFKAFLHQAHYYDIRVVIDLVLNHTSDQHPWFQESRSSRDNVKRDWYVWQDGKHDKETNSLPPNNWESTFTGSAWEYDAGTEQYYYHHFLKEQPDLNWRNPAVKEAMWDVVCFWLDLGVDGFRLDAVGTIFEDPDISDQMSGWTLLKLYQAGESAGTYEERQAVYKNWELLFAHQINQPELHPLMKELRQVVDEYDDRVLIGEAEEIEYYGNGDNELHLVFNFPLMEIEGPLTPGHIRNNQAKRLADLPKGAWPCNTLGNHDGSRVKTAFGDGKNDDALARLSLALLLTLRGTPFLYNGEEIGMTNMSFTHISQLRDTHALRQYEMAIGFGMPGDQASDLVCDYSRDRCRTPMQWKNAENAGFSPQGNVPWLPVNPNYADGVNVADQDTDPDSLLNFYRRMLEMRKKTPALIKGDYAPLLEEDESCFCFLRSTAEQTCLVALNFSSSQQTLTFDGLKVANLIFSNIKHKGEGNLTALELPPFEIYIAAVIKLQSDEKA